MPFHYRSGEEIEIGDYVLFHGESGRIEFIADQLTANPAHDWHIHEFGGGIMVTDPVAGPTFIDAEGIPAYGDLEFVRRGKD